ncbi:MAG: thioesterase [Acidobacteria bacterium]|nr:MAG: thioesterase [Acidobacteriota bacterium]
MPAEQKDPNFEARVRASFALQNIMQLIGARLSRVEPGIVEIDLDSRSDLTQQNGYVHAGIVTTILDSACGYAAHTLMPANSGVLSVEFKVNLLAPAQGERISARAEVKRSGRTLTVCTADAFAINGEDETLCATMLATMFCVKPKGVE